MLNKLQSSWNILKSLKIIGRFLNVQVKGLYLLIILIQRSHVWKINKCEGDKYSGACTDKCIQSVYTCKWKVFGSYGNVYEFPKSGWSNRELVSVESDHCKQLPILSFLSFVVANEKRFTHITMWIVETNNNHSIFFCGCVKLKDY